MPDPDNVLNRGCGKPVGIALAVIVVIVITLFTLAGG